MKKPKECPCPSCGVDLFKVPKEDLVMHHNCVPKPTPPAPSGDYICDYCSSWYTPGDGHACKGTKRTPSEPAANAFDNDDNPIALSVSNGDQASTDEARDAGAIEARELTDDTGVAYEMGWDAAIKFVKGGKK